MGMTYSEISTRKATPKNTHSVSLNGMNTGQGRKAITGNEDIKKKKKRRTKNL